MVKRYGVMIGGILALSLVWVLISEARVSDDDWKKMQSNFGEVYTKAKTPSERILAIQKLYEADHPGVVKLLVSTILPRETKEEDPMVLDAINTLLGKLADTDAINEAITSTKKSGMPAKTILMRALGKYNTPEAQALLVESIGHSDSLVKITAMDALNASTPPEALPKVLEALNSKSWEVKASAINYLSLIKDEEGKKKALETLRTIRPKETGRFKADIAEAINKLSQALNASDEKDSNKTYAFFDIPLEGDVVFVVDVSLSMKQGKTKEGLARIEVLIRELKKVIDAMSKIKPAVKFNIIAYSEKAQEWQDGLVSITTENKEKSLKWINELKLGQFTNIYDAVEMALVGQSTKGGQKMVVTGGSGSPTPYTICLMTDGKANQGKYTSTEEIITAVRILNQSRKIKINTITLGVGADDSGGGGMGGGGMGGMGGGGMTPPDTELMKRLAEENGGVYREF